MKQSPFVFLVHIVFSRWHILHDIFYLWFFFPYADVLCNHVHDQNLYRPEEFARHDVPGTYFSGRSPFPALDVFIESIASIGNILGIANFTFQLVHLCVCLVQNFLDGLSTSNDGYILFSWSVHSEIRNHFLDLCKILTVLVLSSFYGIFIHALWYVKLKTNEPNNKFQYLLIWL